MGIEGPEQSLEQQLAAAQAEIDSLQGELNNANPFSGGNEELARKPLEEAQQRAAELQEQLGKKAA